MVIGAALTDLLPNPFGGFAPFPNSIMIPFMGAQSAVLGYQFGLNYEAGKRMVKSMPNDQFNKLVRDKETFNFDTEGKPQLLLDHLSNTHWREQMKNLQSNIPSALILQDNIIEASVAIELKKANRTPSAMVEIIKAFGASTAQEVRTQLDSFGPVEKTFILAASPLLALLYIFAGGKQDFENTGPKEPEPAPTLDGGLEHTDIIGHEQHPFHSDNEPLSPEETEPIDQLQEPGYPYTFPRGKIGDNNWVWAESKPYLTIQIEVVSLTKALDRLKLAKADLADATRFNWSNSRKNIASWNLVNFENSHHKATGNWI